MGILSRPYPIPYSLSRRLLVSLAIGLFVFLFLYLFMPFGLSELKPSTKLLPICAGYGAVTFVCTALVSVVAPRVLNGYFHEDRWTVGREILSYVVLLLLIGMGNVAFSAAVGFYSFTWGSFLLNVWFVVLVGIFPLTLVVLLRQSRMLRQNLAEAKTLSVKAEAAEWGTHSKSLTLAGAGKRDSLTLVADELISISAADNYCEVWHLQEGTVKKTLLRTSLKELEQQLAEQPHSIFQRVHRSYLVHMVHVVKVSSHPSGLKVQLRHLEQEIPVSRSYQDSLRQKLENTRP